MLSLKACAEASVYSYAGDSSLCGVPVSATGWQDIDFDETSVTSWMVGNPSSLSSFRLALVSGVYVSYCDASVSSLFRIGSVAKEFWGDIVSLFSPAKVTIFFYSGRIEASGTEASSLHGWQPIFSS